MQAMCACESIRKDIIMVNGVNETTSSQNSIYNLSLSDSGTLNLDDKTEKAIRKFFKKQGLNEGDTLDLSTYDKDNNGIIDNDERKEAGLSKKVVNAFNKVLGLKKVQIANTQKKETFNKVLEGDSLHTQRIKNLTQLPPEELNSRIRLIKNRIYSVAYGNSTASIVGLMHELYDLEDALALKK